jgi:hypothetical protein
MHWCTYTWSHGGRTKHMLLNLASCTALPEDLHYLDEHGWRSSWCLLHCRSCAGSRVRRRRSRTRSTGPFPLFVSPVLRLACSTRCRRIFRWPAMTSRWAKSWSGNQAIEGRPLFARFRPQSLVHGRKAESGMLLSQFLHRLYIIS